MGRKSKLSVAVCLGWERKRNIWETPEGRKGDSRERVCRVTNSTGGQEVGLNCPYAGFNTTINLLGVSRTFTFAVLLQQAASICSFLLSKALWTYQSMTWAASSASSTLNYQLHRPAPRSVGVSVLKLNGYFNVKNLKMNLSKEL